MEYFCQITSFWDESTEEEYWDTNCTIKAKQEFDVFEKALAFLKEQSNQSDVNYIEVITRNGASNRHVSFYHQTHPFAYTVGYSFDDIDWFIENESNEYSKRIENPDKVELEMQFIDIFAGLSPEMIKAGNNPEHLFKSIANGEERIGDLFLYLSKKLLSPDLEKQVIDGYRNGLSFFLDGVKAASLNDDYWQKAWTAGNPEEIYPIFSLQYKSTPLNDKKRQFLSDCPLLAFICYFFGLYYVGLTIYVS